MGLHEIKGVGPATVKKLNAAGVRTLEDMRKMDVERVAKRTGLDARRLKEWQREAVGLKILEDVKGIGPAAKRKLQQAGIGNLEDLARASIHEVAHATSIAEVRLQAWQKEAQLLVGKGRARVKQGAATLERTGRRVAKTTKKRAATAARKTRQVAGTAAERTSVIAAEAAERGRHVAAAAKRRSGAIRRDLEASPEPLHVEPVTPSGTDDEDESGRNGGGLLGRLRRVFLPRSS